MNVAYTEPIVREHFTINLSVTQEMAEKKTVLPRGESCLRATHSMRLPRIHNAVCEIPSIKEMWSTLLAP